VPVELSNSLAEVASVTFDVPSWARTVQVIAIANASAVNGAAADTNLVARVSVAGGLFNQMGQLVPAGPVGSDTGAVTVGMAETVSPPGATVEVTLEVRESLIQSGVSLTNATLVAAFLASPAGPA